MQWVEEEGIEGKWICSFKMTSEKETVGQVLVETLRMTKELTDK